MAEQDHHAPDKLAVSQGEGDPLEHNGIFVLDLKQSVVFVAGRDFVNGERITLIGKVDRIRRRGYRLRHAGHGRLKRIELAAGAMEIFGTPLSTDAQDMIRERDKAIKFYPTPSLPRRRP